MSQNPVPFEICALFLTFLPSCISQLSRMSIFAQKAPDFDQNGVVSPLLDANVV